MVIKLKNLLKRILLKFKIDRQLLKLFNNYDYQTFNGKNLIIFAGIGHLYISYFEILLYHLLRKRGFNVTYLIYGKDVPANEVITKEIINSVGKNIFWNKSVNNAIKLLSSASVNFDYIKYNDNVFSEIKISEPKNFSEILNFKYEEINFGKIVNGCLYRYYKSLKFDENVYNIALANLKVSLSNYLELKNRLRYINIDLVLMSHGIYTTWEPIVEFCKASKINFICYDRAKTKNHININLNQNSPNWDFSSAWERYLSRELNTKENLKVDNYLKERVLQRGDVYSYNFSEKEDPISLKKRLGVPYNKKIVTIFTNLIWDAANVSRDIAFVNPLKCIIETIEHYRNNDNVHILLRSHPAEKVLGTDEKYGQLIRLHYNNSIPCNLTIIEPEDNVNSFSVIDISDIGVVNTSTVGVEFALMGKPIILISETNYRKKGFTFDVESEEEYFSVINDQLSNIQLKDNQVVLARKYFYMMMFIYQKNIPLNYENGRFVGYLGDSLKDLEENNAIALILDTIENINQRRDFITWD